MALFGGKKLQELEEQVRSLTSKLEQETAEKNTLAQQLESATRKIGELEEQLNDFDLARLKEQASATIAEYEGLRDLYMRKNKDFDEAKDGKEEAFAREQALKRHDLENEIRDNRQANQDYVTHAVKTFGESYNYYLNQIKVLLDALGDVATRTGEALFSGENDDLKARFGSQMRASLKSGADRLKGEEGDLVLIGSTDEEAEIEAVEPPAGDESFADEPEEVADAVEEAADAVEEVKDELAAALDEAVGSLKDTEKA